MSEEFDGILLGAGHNSLVLQAYLGKAGLKTVCLEERDTAGGGLCTMEDPRHPGFFHNTHSFFHRAITHMPWFKHLELERHGTEYIEPPLNVALITKNNEVLEWWTDFEKTAASFANFSKKDADALRKWRDTFLPIVEQIIVPESMSPPLPPEERVASLQKTEMGRTLLEVSQLSPLEFVLQEFEHPVIQGGLLFFNGLREVDLRCKGFGHHIPALLASAGKAQMCRGGSASLARSLVRAVNESGGEIRLRTTLKRMVVENDRVVGVETGTGEILRAKHFVASGLNPHQTFLELIDEEHTPKEWREKANNFQYNLIAPLFGLNLNLNEAPQYTATQQHPHLDDAFMVIMGLDEFDQFPDIVKHHEQGTIPPTVMWGCTPTRFDSSQAPAGKHTAFMWEKLPYRLKGDAKNWDREREEHGRAMLKLWRRHAPNLEDAVIDSFTRSPLDTERSLRNMKNGDLLIGAFTNGQIGAHRPFPGAGHYRGHLKGLYLCGSACHPGGNITGLPGTNCAKVLFADLDLPNAFDW